jgi:hypothetical protein
MYEVRLRMADQDLALGVVNRTDGEGGAVLFRGEADGDCSARCDRSGRQRERERGDGERESEREHAKVMAYKP